MYFAQLELSLQHMKLSPNIIQLLSKQCSHPISIPADCEYLALDIQSKTGVRLGATTLKRLMGFADDERHPHKSTLNVIARYLGYHDWQQLSLEDAKGNSGFDTDNEEIRSADLQTSDRIEIHYLPDREVTFKYIGDCHYQVIASKNSKLKVGDLATVQNFILNHPLFVSAVIRNGKNLGPFTAGRVSGLSYLQKL